MTFITICYILFMPTSFASLIFPVWHSRGTPLARSSPRRWCFSVCTGGDTRQAGFPSGLPDPKLPLWPWPPLPSCFTYIDYFSYFSRFHLTSRLFVPTITGWVQTSRRAEQSQRKLGLAYRSRSGTSRYRLPLSQFNIHSTTGERPQIHPTD